MGWIREGWVGGWQCWTGRGTQSTQSAQLISIVENARDISEEMCVYKIR